MLLMDENHSGFIERKGNGPNNFWTIPFNRDLCRLKHSNGTEILLELNPR
jgi:hypothetical protein